MSQLKRKEPTVPAQDRFGVRDLAAPWYAGQPGFMRAPWVEPDSVPEGHIAVAGMPVDWFTAGRSGARWGPRAIREASLYLAGYYGLQTDRGFIDVFSKEIVAWPDHHPVVDTGDVPVIPVDTKAQTDAAIEHVTAISRTSDLTLVLGGDHYVTYPSFEGVIGGWRERKDNLRAGHLHVDSHTDFFDELSFLGRYNHGTCARRISEIPEVKRMAWFGLNGGNILEPGQLDLMHEKGYQCFTTSYIARVGVEQAIKETLEYVMDGIDILYVTLDIDVLNGSVAPATHSPVFEGLSGHEFLQVARALATIDNLVGLDLCEVAPSIAPTGQTERLAALALMTVIGPRVMQVIGLADEKKWDEVVHV